VTQFETLARRAGAERALLHDLETKGRVMSATTLEPAPSAGQLFHRPVATGPAYWGPGDHYTFLVTGEESGGAYFAMEALVPPGGGPPPHIHRREDETFYLIEGDVEFRLGDEVITAGPGDFVNVPRGTVHRFRNAGTQTARMVLTFTPAGIEHWFDETLEQAPNHVEEAPDNMEEVAARYVAAAPRYGLEFV
jgi:quercetin dioxygenase-like cupin family protein